MVEDTARFRERIDREVSALEAMTDLPPSLVPAVQAARRLMRNGNARDFDMPEPVDAHAASMLVLALHNFLTERTMHNAWRKRADEAESTLADLRRQGEWQPIASAPKDADCLLLWWPYWSNRATIGYWKHSMWIAENALSDATNYTEYPEPTHWRPLPDPPAQS